MKRKADRGLGPVNVVPSIPIPPPGLLERAKKLGAVSAGPANVSRELHSAAIAVATKPVRKPAARKRSHR